MNYETSLDVLVHTLSEQDFFEYDCCEKVLSRIFAENRIDLLNAVLKKLSFAFFVKDEEFRAHILNTLLKYAKKMNIEAHVNAFQDNVPGNLFLLGYTARFLSPITVHNFKRLKMFLHCPYIMDEDVLNLYPLQDKIVLDLTTNLQNQISQRSLIRLVKILELLFQCKIIQESKESVISFYHLYGAISQSPYTLKHEIIESLLNKKIQTLLKHVNKITSMNIDKNCLNAEVVMFSFKVLRNLRIPVYWHLENVRFNGEYINDNFFITLYKDASGSLHIFWPYDKISASEIKSVLDIRSGSFVIPSQRYGKLLLEQIYSFNEVAKVKNVSEEEINLVKNMTEKEMERAIRHILRDCNETAHSPIEVVDIYELKLHVNGIDDVRNAGFILKGRSYHNITLNTIATNIIKAVDSPVDIIFIIYVGKLQDEVLTHLERLCQQTNKMYCVIDSNDLARLLKAYNLFPKVQGEKGIAR